MAKIIASPGVREGIRGMKKPNKNKGKSYVDIMKEAGEKYGVKVTDMSEQGVRAVGLLSGVGRQDQRPDKPNSPVDPGGERPFR